ncbi:MarR family winged helix-turn-helix transcriptional regulator [Clostridium botulinum]|uniref:Transcriptional regulator, MarR family n=3 Tax=Clostridium botulinum TaxID=1491 RepID=C1FQ34_CLOBJ|nr:MarR family transcriptional regulator [Clostridium botulinum]EKN41679.1 MarR family transcriptional regulator [Clostridium botulinum CFSAN001627]ACO85258.1 transcriptional regulator, MarR family [Clostridium botulinum A2 str. Kyoto]APC81965.1 winged helix DNA-binding domain protein [Clostridium botulinum]APC83467.1 winged helix DNA-binding domain protein [Clostridium botulinum]APH21869.1 winged helix DNA-binding domain protein [Clostridium botulinum]
MDNMELSKELIKFMITMKKQIKECLNLNSTLKLTEQQFVTLFILKKNKKITLKKLSTYICVSTSSLCIMLTRMMEEELVYREVDERDRRNTFYSLTEKGVNLIDKEIEGKVDNIEEKIMNLSLSQKEKLYEAIKNIEEIIDILE